MWIPAGTLELIVKAKEAADLKIEALLSQVLATSGALNESRGERMQMEVERARLQADVEWMRLRINQLELTNTEMLARLAGIRIPAAEIESVGRPRTRRNPSQDAAMNPFEDPEEIQQANQVVRQDDQAQAEEILRKHGMAIPRVVVET